MVKILKKHKGWKKKTTFATFKKYIIVSLVLFFFIIKVGITRTLHSSDSQDCTGPDRIQSNPFCLQEGYSLTHLTRGQNTYLSSELLTWERTHAHLEAI